MIGRGEFLEWAQVFGNYYGTHRGFWRKPGGKGKDLVLDIDVQGARQLIDQIPEAVTVFILAPSRQVLEQRLRDRGEDRDEVIERRLGEAAEEIRNYKAYDYVLINRDLDESDAVLSAIVGAERARRTRIEDRIPAHSGDISNVEKESKLWPTKPPRNNAHCTIPDDPEQSTYRFIIVAAKRARQLQGGARPVLPTSSKKPTIIAMEEVRRGLVKYSLTGQAPEQPLEEAEPVL